MSRQAVSVFFSYSQKDAPLRNELAKHLDVLKHNRVISSWYDGEILPGEEWDSQIKNQLDTAQIILLLVSSDFLSSSYCRDVEITRAMERHRAGEARVIPIILRPCQWHITAFGRLQALPDKGTPVMDLEWETLDHAFLNIANGIYKVATSFISPIPSTLPVFPAPVGQVSEGTQKHNAQAIYRERLREYLTDHQLSDIHKVRLELLREQLTLSEAEAQLILSEELAPLEQNRKKYREILQGFIKADINPLDEKAKQELGKVRQELALTESEANSVAQPVLRAAEHKLEVLGAKPGIDYIQLRDLLKDGKWEAANKETFSIMLREVGTLTSAYISKEDAINFPSKDLLTIDRLWLKYSNERFGFSVQKRIARQFPQIMNSESNDRAMFFQHLGWCSLSRLEKRSGGYSLAPDFKRYSEAIFNISAPVGHLPFFCSNPWKIEKKETKKTSFWGNLVEGAITFGVEGITINGLIISRLFLIQHSDL